MRKWLSTAHNSLWVVLMVQVKYYFFAMSTDTCAAQPTPVLSGYITLKYNI